MTKVEVVIRPEKLEELQHELEGLGMTGMTVTEVRGAGRQAGYVERYRGMEYRVRLLPKVKVELVVADDRVEEVISTITAACRTGEVGDGKIFLWKLDNAVRIRTGDRGNDAL
ncbi:MAG: nitrogen regulatory protein 1 [Arthrobacter sp.]|jgi:nitrogen regulatory protein P-II 1|nr:nitrogen regulatory protein 1 [Arthrobacter sp.]